MIMLLSILLRGKPKMPAGFVKYGYMMYNQYTAVAAKAALVGRLFTCISL
jgi:hypothetical protein